MGGMKETLGTRPNGGAQPLLDRGAMSVSQRNFVNFWIGRQRPPLVGQIKKMLALLGEKHFVRGHRKRPQDVRTFFRWS